MREEDLKVVVPINEANAEGFISLRGFLIGFLKFLSDKATVCGV